MESLRHILRTIGEQLGKLSASHKLLIGSLAVIVAMTLLLVAQYAGQPTMTPLLPGAAPDDQGQAMTFVSQRGLPHEMGPGGEVLVPAGQREAIFAQMTQSGAAPANTELVFQNLIDQQKWWISNEQNEQLYLIALQNELSRTIRSWNGVRAASVIIDAPKARGLGGGVRLPTASVTVHTESGTALKQDLVDAVARFVAGAKSGLVPEAVNVIDGSTGRARAIAGEEDSIHSTYREYAASVEKQFREKIYSIVSDIEGVVVQVTAAVDVTRVTRTEEGVLPKGEGSEALVRRERSHSITGSGGSQGGEPGLRSNTRLDINASGSGAGAGYKETDDETEFEVLPGMKRVHVVDPRGQPTRIVATINVPRRHILGLLGGADEEGQEPGAGVADEEVEAAFLAERTRIEERVRPHVRTLDEEGGVVEGEVVVSLVSGPAFASGAGGAGGGLNGAGGGAGGGSMLSLAEGMVEKGVLVALAVVAMGMMLMMARRIGKRVELPSAEELVGIPPALPADEDLVGEASERDSPLAGIELGEGEIANDRIREQVSELIQQNPDEAAVMLKRWIRQEA